MRVYARDRVCPFRFTKASWGQLSNFYPLAAPIAAGPWLFATSEATYQVGKFPARPDIQQRIAEAPTAREAAAIGRTPGFGIDPGWNAQRVDVMRWVLRMKREANAAEIDAVLAATGEHPIVEVSTRDPLVGAPNPSRTATRATTSSAGSGWNCGSSFARTTRPPTPAPGPTASVSDASPAAALLRKPRRRAPDRRLAAPSRPSKHLPPIPEGSEGRPLEVWLGSQRSRHPLPAIRRRP